VPVVGLLEGRIVPTATAIGLSFSPPAIVYGQTENITATVAADPPSGPTPTGGMVFFNYKSITLGSAPLVNGTATLTTTALPAGTDEVFADYSGAAPFDPTDTTDNPLPVIHKVLIHTDTVIATDSAGDLFYTDGNFDSLVKELSTTGDVTLVAGGGTGNSPTYQGPATGVELHGVTGLAVFGQTLYLADFPGLIRAVDLTSHQISTYAGGGPDQEPNNRPDFHGPATSATLALPSGLAVDGQGNLYIADTGNNIVRKVDASDGVISTVAGTGTRGFTGEVEPATESMLDTPTGLAVDPSGILYISDSGNNRVRLLNPASGNLTTIVGGGTVTNPAAIGAPRDIALNQPADLAISSDDSTLYIADAGNDVVRKVNKSRSLISTYAGTGQPGEGGDGGPANRATFFSPSGLALDPDGNLFVGAIGEASIREVSAKFQVVVAPAPLTITADDKTWNVGDRFPILTASFSGFENGDSAANLTAPPMLTTAAGLASGPGRYPITVSGAMSPNYKIAFADGTLTVTLPTAPPPDTGSGGSGSGGSGSGETGVVVSGQPPQATGIVTTLASKKGLAAFTLGFSQALDQHSAINPGLYHVLAAVKKRGMTLYTKPVAIQSITYDAVAHAVTINLAKPVKKGAVKVTVDPGIVAVNGAASTKGFSTFVK
jgi:sugar lactone lactonase YvrE